ncbi:MAG: Fe(2+)-trafficking protein [Deltaproteobacteria bacterium]|nr:Fe(2+)-trafficking protein [Deltaproteobacteria bacterium]
MANIQCARCGNEGPPPDFIPYEGALKAAIVSQICSECWEAWKKMSVMVINEFRLTPFLPEHRQVLEQHMKDFLKYKA